MVTSMDYSHLFAFQFFTIHSAHLGHDHEGSMAHLHNNTITHTERTDVSPLDANH